MASNTISMTSVGSNSTKLSDNRSTAESKGLQTESAPNVPEAASTPVAEKVLKADGTPEESTIVSTTKVTTPKDGMPEETAVVSTTKVTAPQDSTNPGALQTFKQTPVSNPVAPTICEPLTVTATEALAPTASPIRKRKRGYGHGYYTHSDTDSGEEGFLGVETVKRRCVLCNRYGHADYWCPKDNSTDDSENKSYSYGIHSSQDYSDSSMGDSINNGTDSEDTGGSTDSGTHNSSDDEEDSEDEE